MNDVYIVRRLDSAEYQESRCHVDGNCPGVFELSDGNILIIGEDVTEELRNNLPPGSGAGPDEKIVVVPREVLATAGWELPDFAEEDKSS